MHVYQTLAVKLGTNKNRGEEQTGEKEELYRKEKGTKKWRREKG